MAALALVLAACSEEPTIVEPVIDVPADDLDATATGLDEITLTVAHARSDRELVQQTFARGDALEVPGVPFGDDLVIHMSGFVGASNVAYGRSCAFAMAPGGGSPAPHVFFSRSVKFATVSIAPLPRIGGFGIAYLGNALLIGGSDGLGAVPEVEMFDPLIGQLRVVGSVAPRARAVQALIGTSPPRVLVLGGEVGSVGAKSLEVVDDRRVETLEYPELARVGLTATTLTDGRVVVIGGYAPSATAAPVPVGEIDELTETDGGALEVRRLTAALARPRSGHTATRLGEDFGAPVLIAGGIDGTGAAVDLAELFKPLSEELANSNTFKPAMKAPRRGHTATLMPDGSVLFIGGVDAGGTPVRKLELFSVDAGFVPAGDLPDGAGVVDFATTTLPDGRILITGGRAGPDMPPLNTAYIARLDPLSGSVDVVATDRMVIARANHQAVLLCDGTVLVSGGNAGQFAAERYNPPSLGRR